MLRHLLNSHPQLCCHGEVMSGPIKSLVGLDEQQETPLHRKLEQERAADPIGFLRKYVQCDAGIAGAGFKIKYDELVLPQFATLLATLRADKSLKVVHLRRENRFKRFVSHHAAVHVHGVYNVLDEASRPKPKLFELMPEACEADFELIEKREREFVALFSDHQVHEVIYEQLLDGKTSALLDLQKFLGVEGEILSSRTVRMNPENSRQIVQNYDAIAGYFANTPHQHYFEYASSQVGASA